jgi:glutathione-regulated potassium-efflux system ancillary protein KefC
LGKLAGVSSLDPLWLLIALLLGLGAQQLKLPPLVGFLLAGFVLHGLGEEGGQLLQLASDMGVLLLLFTIGLKLRLKSFLSPAVWGGGTAHMLLSCAFMAAVLGVLGAGLLASIDWNTALLIAFALSFSSTVVAVKIYEERGETRARHALVSIGILIIQDVLAVVFLLVANAEPLSIWGVGLISITIIRPVLIRLLNQAGHGEMLVLFGITVTIAGAALFDAVGMKDGLGALVFGALLSNHPKSIELTRALLSFKDFLLIGFFLSIGLLGFPAIQDLLVVMALVLILLPLKMLLYFLLLTRFRLRARSAFLATLGLATFSEFGLIVANEGVAVGWLGEQWLVMIAIAAALSFVLASALNVRAHQLYEDLREFLCRFETAERLPDDRPPNVGDADVLIIGMGRVGRSTYRTMTDDYANQVCGVDVDSDNVKRLQELNYRVVFGDAEDVDFWRAIVCERIKLIMLSLPNHDDMLLAVKLLKTAGYHGRIGAITKYADNQAELVAAGVDSAFNYYTEVGTGFAEHVQRETAAD